MILFTCIIYFMSKNEERIISPTESVNDDKNFDLSLRPKTFSDYIGQDNIKTNLQIITYLYYTPNQSIIKLWAGIYIV